MIRHAWRAFGLVAAFVGALMVSVYFASPELLGTFYPETGSGKYALPAPCPGSATGAGWVALEGPGVRIQAPPGDWERVPATSGGRSVAWRDRRTRDGITVEVMAGFPGRPRIERGHLHGIVALERCRERRGSDSAWIASAMVEAYGTRRLSIALVPLPDGRWLRATAATEDGEARQRAFLATVRTVGTR